jgi:hypothetical protein
MNRLKLGIDNDLTPMAIEATNNRNAVKALRRALVKIMAIEGHDSCPVQFCDYGFAKRLIAETTPKKLAGGK